MNKELQKYIRESFPEYSNITVSEIFSIKYNDADFIEDLSKIYGFHNIVDDFIVKDFFIIDISEFFDRYRSQFTDVFIDVDSFQLNIVNGYYSINLHDTNKHSELFLINKLNRGEIFIKYKDETFKYNQCNLDNIMFTFVSSLTKNKNPDSLLSSFIFGYLKHNTDFTSFLYTRLSNNKIIIGITYNLFSNEIYGVEGGGVIIEFTHDCINILDYNSNTLLKKDLNLITTTNFFNEIIEPLKSIIINMDDIRKENFETLWKQDLNSYLLSLLKSEKDLNDIKIEVFPSKDMSKFLNKVLHTRRPKMQISFLLNSDIISSCIVDGAYDYDHYSNNIINSYNIYKSLAEADYENKALNDVFKVEHNATKIKRI